MPPKSSESFSLFPLLPAELRLKIWQAVASEAHTIELSCTSSDADTPKGRWFSYSKPPSIFSICSESRRVALSQYSTLNPSEGQLGIPWHKLYINFNVDTLWLCAGLDVIWVRDLLEKNDQLKGNLRFLAVNGRSWKELNPLVLMPVPMMAISGGGFTEYPKSVRSQLRALEHISFHS